MSTDQSTFDPAEQQVLADAAAVARELLAASPDRDRTRAVQALASCRPTAQALAGARPVLTALRDRCIRESSTDFWLAELGDAADNLDRPVEMVESLADVRHAQAHVLSQALAAVSRVQQAVPA